MAAQPHFRSICTSWLDRSGRPPCPVPSVSPLPSSIPTRPAPTSRREGEEVQIGLQSRGQRRQAVCGPGERSLDEFFHRVAHVGDTQPIGYLGLHDATDIARIPVLKSTPEIAPSRNRRELDSSRLCWPIFTPPPSPAHSGFVLHGLTGFDFTATSTFQGENGRRVSVGGREREPRLPPLPAARVSRGLPMEVMRSSCCSSCLTGKRKEV